LVEVDDRPVTADAWRHRRGADLVKLLALTPQHRLHREQLMESLWPGLQPEAAAANLRKAVHYARRGLGGREAIDAQGDMVALWPAGRLSVDIHVIEAEAAAALATGVGLEAAAEGLAAELLPEDRYAEWTEPHRERLRSRRLEVLRAAGSWDRVLELDRTDEEACRALMRTHLEAGNRAAAIRQFQRLREILRVDLGVGPEPSTVALFEQAVATGDRRAPSPAETAQALLARGLVHWNQRQLDAAEKLAEEARALSIDHRLGRELGEASALLGMVAMARGRWPDRFRAEFADALRLGRDHAPYLLEAHVCLAEASLHSADKESVAALAHELLPLAIEAESIPCEALMSLLIGESELFSGQLEGSREWLSRAVELYEAMGGASGRAFALVRLAEVALLLEQPGPAARHLAVARRLANHSELASHLVIRVLAASLQATDDPERRRLVLAEADEALRPKEACGPCSIGFRVAAAIACARSGELARARQFLADAERLSGLWQGGPWQAAVWEARAALRLAAGDRVQAAALLHEAAMLFAECGRPLEEARCIAAAEPIS
jgi:DNA-binding SARP family transcriptional activator